MSPSKRVQFFIISLGSLLYTLPAFANFISKEQFEFAQKDPNNRCELGTFYNAPEAKEVCESAFVGNHPELFAPVFLYCFGSFLLPEATDKFCGCDCLYAHRATGGYKACIMQDGHSRPTACWCKYKPGENPCLPTSDEEASTSDNTGGLLPALAMANRSSTHNKENTALATTATLPDHFNRSGRGDGDETQAVEGVDDGLGDLIAAKCKPFMQAVITFVCEAEPINYLTYTLEGADLCIIDCKCSHGSQTPPYGMCRKEWDGALLKEISICYCIL